MIGESTSCTIGLWTALRVEIFWWLWLAQLGAIYGDIQQDFGTLKNSLIKTGESYYIKMLNELESTITWILQDKQRSCFVILQLESL